MSSYNNDVIIISHTNEYDDSQSDMLPETGDWIGHQTTMSSNNVPGSYVTNVTVSSMCLCCTGQQARRCSVNIDLQLAAELGNTLLEKNKDLEATIKQQQNLIDDQIQEIEFLTKQTAALKEVNESRVRIYEQIEISLSELEDDHSRLSEESASEKIKIKSLSFTVQALENRCAELQKHLEEAESLISYRKEKRKSFLIQNADDNISPETEKVERKTSVCIQDLFAGVGVLHLENQKQSENKNLCLSEPRSCDSESDKKPRKISFVTTVQESHLHLHLEISRLNEQLSVGREKIRELEDQIECLLTAQQIIWKHQKNLSESNNNLIESENNNLMCMSCSKYHSSSNILTNFMEEVQHLSSGFLSSRMRQDRVWIDQLLLICVLSTVLLGLLAAFIELLF